jgi:putative FmdB family regulatory protein
MPSYDYICIDCARRFVIFLTYAEYGHKPVSCPHCKSSHVTRRIGRIRIAYSDDNRLENMADPSNLDGIDNDPKALGRMMRQMSQQMGEDMGPEFKEVVGRLESGQSPEDIENALPDFGSDEGNSSGGMDDF